MRSLCFVLFLSVSAALADEPAQRPEKPWPQKGDTVFVSAELAKVWLDTKLGPEIRTEPYPVPPCVPLLVTKAKDRLWFTRDPGKMWQRLEGPWLPRFHKDREECEERFGKLGQPKVVLKGTAQLIVE